MRKTTFATQSRLVWFSIQILVNSKIFKLSLNLSLTHLRTQIASYKLKGNLSPVMLKEIFHDSFENFEITRICMENHASVTGWQKLFSSYKCFQLLAAVAIATFEIYGSKFSGYIILICSLLTNFFKSELFSCLPKVDHVMRSCQQDYLMITKRIMVPSPCF